jgi:hypothetical protein
MDDETTDVVLESLRQSVDLLERAGTDRDEVTTRLLALLIERVQPQVSDNTIPAEMCFDPGEIMLLTIAGQLAKRRKGTNNIPELSLLSYSAERCYQLLGREKLRSHLEFLCTELTAPSDFWGK